MQDVCIVVGSVVCIIRVAWPLQDPCILARLLIDVQSLPAVGQRPVIDGWTRRA